MTAFHLRIGAEERYPVFPLLFYTIPEVEVPARATGQEKEIKSVHRGKEKADPPLLIDQKTLYIENSKETTKKLITN